MLLKDRGRYIVEETTTYEHPSEPPSTAEQKLGKTTPHLVLPIPDELEGLLKRLGVALPWGSSSTSNKATKISEDIPKTLQNKEDGIISLQEDTRCVSPLHLPIFVVSLLFFCVKGPVSTNNWFPRHGSNWESTTRKAVSLRGFVALKLAGWAEMAHVGNSETRSKQTSDPHLW